jgi:tetratricopeptide (TPR) repeat protein
MRFGPGMRRFGIVCVLWRVLVAQDPDRAELERLAREGQAALAQKRFEAAARSYEVLVKSDPKTAENYAQLGVVRYMQGDFARAVPAFRKALDLKPGLSGVDVLLAMCLSEMGRYAEALPGLETGFQHPPDPAMRRLIALELERSYQGLQELEKAAEVALRLSRLYPDDPELMYHAGRLYGDLAYDTMRRLARLAPDSAWVHQASGEAHEIQGHFDLAILEYRKVLELDPARPGIHFRLGRVLLARAGDGTAAEEALRQFEKELETDASSASAAYEIGEIYRKSGRLEQARTFFARAAEQQPDFEEARIGLARVLIELGRPREALPHLEAAVHHNAENDVAQYQLAMVYKALGNAAEQQKAMDQFRRLRALSKARQPLTQAPRRPGDVTRQTIDSEVR